MRIMRIFENDEERCRVHVSEKGACHAISEKGACHAIPPLLRNCVPKAGSSGAFLFVRLSHFGHSVRVPKPLIAPGSAVTSLVSHVRSMGDFLIEEPMAGYQHMGAVIADATLQAGVNYKTVVAPKVARLIQNYPQCVTTSMFRDALNSDGPEKVLGWTRGRKPETARALAELLIAEEIETVGDLKAWIQRPTSRAKLLAVSGVGPKTADYLGLLAGRTDVAAIDMHLNRFLRDAGISPVSYDQAQTIIIAAAEQLDVSPATLDHSIWQYMSNRKEGAVTPSRHC